MGNRAAARKGDRTPGDDGEATEFAQLVAFYDANKLFRVTLNWNPDGANYVCFFAGPPGKLEYETPTLVKVGVALVEQ